MCHLAGTLLIHSVAEEAFWLLSGLINTALKEYYVKEGQGLKMDAAVFEAVIRGSERELSSAFKDAGVKGEYAFEISRRKRAITSIYGIDNCLSDVSHGRLHCV